MSYYLNSNLTIKGDLTTQCLIMIKGEVTGIEPITNLIGSKEIYEGNLELTDLIISESDDFELIVEGNTTTLSSSYLDELHG